MKKRILLITPLYPTNDKLYTVTPVCHYYAKEWVKAGYEVKVVNITVLFPKLYNILAKPILPLIKAKTGYSIYTNCPTKPNKYIYEGVEVWNIPIKQYYPHQMPSDKTYSIVSNIIKEYAEADGFVPDIITGHIVSPTFGVIYKLKQSFRKATTCLVIHGIHTTLTKVSENYSDMMKSIDVWGFRSMPSMKSFNRSYPDLKNTFVCYSGIPESYISKDYKRYYNGISSVAFLGSLYKLKKVDVIISALKRSSLNWHLNIIGGGAELNNLKKLSKTINMEGQVTFWGKQPREQAQSILSKSDCYTMISHEAFGLVYLEAMAKGLITIGLKNSGIDGVIINGKNGFLCEDQSVESLMKLYIHLSKLSSGQLEDISRNAIETVAKLTDKNVAETYIANIFRYSNTQL